MTMDAGKFALPPSQTPPARPREPAEETFWAFFYTCLDKLLWSGLPLAQTLWKGSAHSPPQEASDILNELQQVDRHLPQPFFTKIYALRTDLQIQTEFLKTAQEVMTWLSYATHLELNQLRWCRSLQEVHGEFLSQLAHQWGAKAGSKEEKWVTAPHSPEGGNWLAILSIQAEAETFWKLKTLALTAKKHLTGQDLKVCPALLSLLNRSQALTPLVQTLVHPLLTQIHSYALHLIQVWEESYPELRWEDNLEPGFGSLSNLNSPKSPALPLQEQLVKLQHLVYQKETPLLLSLQEIQRTLFSFRSLYQGTPQASTLSPISIHWHNRIIWEKLSSLLPQWGITPHQTQSWIQNARSYCLKHNLLASQGLENELAGLGPNPLDPGLFNRAFHQLRMQQADYPFSVICKQKLCQNVDALQALVHSRL
jgi:hypothetical protein